MVDTTIREWPNCIDPAIFTDADGRMWMNYGSWSGGIFLLEIDPTTGYPIYPVDDKDADPYYGYRLIGGGHHSAEVHISSMTQKTAIIICLFLMEICRVMVGIRFGSFAVKSQRDHMWMWQEIHWKIRTIISIMV